MLQKRNRTIFSQEQSIFWKNCWVNSDQKKPGHEIIWSIYRLESHYTLAARSRDFLASTLTIQQFQNFSGLKLNVNGEFKFDIYRVEKGNKKSVSKTYHSTKSMHAALFLLYFVNQQQKNCCLLSNEWFPKNCDAIYTKICKKSRIPLEVRKQVPLENTGARNIL